MKTPLRSRRRGLSLAQLLGALGLAALLPLPAAAECFGPYPSFPAAQTACRSFLNTGFCSSNPDEGAFVEIIGYTTPSGFPAAACCCLALVALEIPPIEDGENGNEDEGSNE